jgi:hypothetical protein
MMLPPSVCGGLHWHEEVVRVPSPLAGEGQGEGIAATSLLIQTESAV